MLLMRFYSVFMRNTSPITVIREINEILMVIFQFDAIVHGALRFSHRDGSLTDACETELHD